MTRCSLVALCLLAFAFAPLRPAVAGILHVEVVAATGTVYDWLPEGVMLDVYVSSKGNMMPVANNTGHLAWSSDLRGQNVVFGVNDQGLFRRAPDGTISLLARKGDQAQDAPEGAKWFSFSPTCLAADGTLFFRGKLDSIDGGGGVTKESDYLAGRVAPDGTITILAREGLAVPGLPGYALKGNSGESTPPPLYPSCAADGQATFVHPITVADSSEWAVFQVDSEGNTTVVYRTGDDVPGLDQGEEFLAFAKSPRINSSGQMTFRGVLQGGDGGVYVGGGQDTGLLGPGSNGLPTLLMREGDIAPGSPQGVYEDIDVHMDMTIAADGAVAFIHSFKFDDWFIESGLYRHDPANPGVLTSLLMQNAPAEGLPEGWSYGYPASLTGNASGRLAVQGVANFGEDDQGDPLEDEEAVWVQDDNGDLLLAAITGETAPGTGGAKRQAINNALFMNASGQTTFAGTLVKLEPVTSFNDYGIWLYTPGEDVELLLREGTEIVVGEGDTRTVSQITQAASFQTGSGGADGLPMGLTDEGQAPFVVRFTGSAPAPGFETNAAVIVASVTPDPCDPDKIDCDDEDACTDDTCTPEAGCVHVPVECDDADNCTDDTCDADAGCLSTAKDCDDSDACTDDSCDEAGACQHAAADCDDADACTDDSCDADSGCQSVATHCDDADVCTTDSCDLVAGCQNVAIDCDDSDACTDDSCDPVTGCQNTTVDCSDGSDCTDDSCAPETGCQYVDVDCDDDDSCTDDMCDPEAGCSHLAVDCDDQNACTEESCDPETGCQHLDVDCDDTNLCTDDLCDAGTGCSYSTVDCDDKSACTIDSCAEEAGCEYETVECEDEDACTVDSCNPAIGCENVELKCDDNVACTADSCDSDTGCVNTEIVCNDENPCTLDSCDLGKCISKKDPDQPLCCVDDADCHDGDICTTDACVTELCEFTEVGNCCAKDMDCSDGNVCTVDFCDQAVHQCISQPMDGCCLDDEDCAADLKCIDFQCRSPWCVACETDGDCGTDGAVCAELASGSYCLASCDGGCPDGYECGDTICVPEAGDCNCVAEPGQFSCDGSNWVKSDTCGQLIEVAALCEFECASIDGCCQEGTFSVGDKCVETLPPDADDTDVVTSEDVSVAEEVIELPEVQTGEDVPPVTEDLAGPEISENDALEEVEFVEQEASSKGDSGCSAGGASTASLWLFLAMFAALALARRRGLAS